MSVTQFRWTSGSSSPEFQVSIFVTDRRDGLSQAPWSDFNLAMHVGDDPAAVQSNRELLTDAIGVPVAWADQVHGTHIAQVGASPCEVPTADGLLTTVPGLACSMLVADCLPVVLSHRVHPCVASVHAGWRGLSAGVIEAAIASMARAVGEPVAEFALQLSAWLGPCIGPEHFEVGPEVRLALEDGLEVPDGVFAPSVRGGRHMADLAALARLRLVKAGVAELSGNDSSPMWCTHGQPRRYFSHRRDGAKLGTTGRMAVGVWISRRI